MARLKAEIIYAPAEEKADSISYQELLGERIEVSTNPPDKMAQKFFEEHRALLREIIAHPTASTSEHYRNLGWSVGRASRVKNEVEEMGLISVICEKGLNGRPREILSVNDLGLQVLGHT